MSLYKKKICVVTGSRAEYGILKNLIFEIKKSKKLKLQLIVTGMHLSNRYGLTYKEIIQDGLYVNKKIKILKNSDTSKAISNSISVGIKKFSNSFNILKPDLVLILGDRFEIFSTAIAAMLARIPIAHIHGGELTEGAIDDAIRHSITKMSHLHFVATKEYRNRVIQLGELPKNVHIVGGMGVDTIKKTKFYKIKKLERKIGFKMAKKNILVNFHPVTLEKNSSRSQISELLGALKNFKDTKIIFTMPNADQDSQVIFKEINKFVKKNKNSTVFKSLGSLTYLSCLKLVDVIVGNSSSGLLEAPTLKVPTIDIGERQKGRLNAKSVFNCKPKKREIISNLKSILEKRKKLSFENPYGRGGSSKKIVSFLEKINYKILLKKKFYQPANLYLSKESEKIDITKNDTVLITTLYPKGKKYFKYFFKSLNQQTTNKFDVLLANDGVNKLDFLPFLKNIKFRIINVSGNRSDIRRKLIVEAIKKYKKIIFSDCDDILYKNRIEFVSKMLDKNDIVINDIDLYNEKQKLIKKNYFSGRIKDGSKITIKSLESGNMMGLSNTAARSEALHKCPALLYENKNPYAFDWYLWSSVLLNAFDAKFTNKTGIKYCCRSNSLTELGRPTDLEYATKVVNLKYEHYSLMKKLDNSFLNLANDFEKMKSKLSNKIWLKNYISFTNKNSIRNHFWWENIKSSNI